MDKFVSKISYSTLLSGAALALGLTAIACSSDSENPAAGPITENDAGTGGGDTGGSGNGGQGGQGAKGGQGGQGGKVNTGGGGTSAGGGGATGTGGTDTDGGDTDATPPGTGGTDAGDVDACSPDAPTLPATVPTAIAAPAGVELVAQFHATGTQNYKCTGTAPTTDGGVTTYAWTFIGPVAKLFDSCNVQVGEHKAGPKGATGPEWISLGDGSLVEGAKLASSAVTGAVPLLLLKATDHSGSGIFTPVTFIHRLDTTGGVAPDAATCGSGNLDEVKTVDYTANYYFYSGPTDGGP